MYLTLGRSSTHPAVMEHGPRAYSQVEAEL